MNLVVAVTSNGCIGYNNELVVRDKQDLKLFKALTIGGVVIMGRKTFESIGSKPLSNRKNIVISNTLKQCSKETLGVIVVKDIIEAFDHIDDGEEIFFIGGGEIYEQAVKFCKKVYVSMFQRETVDDCDTYFPIDVLYTEYDLQDVQIYDNFKLGVYERK